MPRMGFPIAKEKKGRCQKGLWIDISKAFRETVLKEGGSDSVLQERG